MVGDTLLGKSIDDQIASSFFRARFFLCEFIELTSAIESIQGNNTAVLCSVYTLLPALPAVHVTAVLNLVLVYKPLNLAKL